MASMSFGQNNGFQVGTSNGHISATFLAPERPETPPSPVSTVPFRQDPDFVKRDGLLQRIHEKSATPGSAIALVGLGGVGKTQLAIEYSYQIRRQQPDTWVFWVHASNPDRFKESFRDIADQARIPGRNDCQVDICSLVRNWLRNGVKERWILILDNIDDDVLLRERRPASMETQAANHGNTSSTHPLFEFIPRTSKGTLIATSRNRKIALKLVAHDDIIMVEPMRRSEASELLQKKLDLQRETSEVRDLAQELDFMPLAISQAAGYIKHRAPRSSISQYLAKLKKSDRDAIRLLDTRKSSSSDDSEQQRLILATWAVSFEHIRESNASAANLLSLMSFFDRQGVSERLLRGAPEDEDSISETDADQDFEDDITVLRDYSLISVTENGMFFTLHRLVQLAVQRWLKAHGQIEELKERFLENLFQETPPPFGQPAYEDWGIYQALYPHMKSAITQRPQSSIFKRKWAILISRAALYAAQSGHDSITDAREMALKPRKELLALSVSESSPSIEFELFEATEALSRIYYSERLLDKAIELQMYLMENRKKALGEEHADTLNGMDLLALYLMADNQLDEAKNIQTQVIRTRERTLGTDHSETLYSTSQLAIIFEAQKRLQEAEKLLLEVLPRMRSLLGNTHSHTVEAMQSLGRVFGKQGRLDEAEQLCTEVMKTRKRVLPKNHPDTVRAMQGLGQIFVQQGRLDEAEQLQNQVLETSKSVFGERNPRTVWSMQILADIFAQQNRLGEAEQVYERVIETRKRILVENHVDTIDAMRRLAWVLREQGRFDEAEKLEKEVETRKMERKE